MYVNDFKVTLELLIAAHPNVSFNSNLTSLLVFKSDNSSQVLLSFMDNYVRVIVSHESITTQINKFKYDDPEFKQKIIRIIAEWI